MVSRLETMVLMSGEIPIVSVRSQIASAVDIIIHLGRLRDKSRKLLEISEVTGLRNNEVQLSTLYKFRETSYDGRISGVWERIENLKNTEKLQRAGIKLTM